MDRNIDIYASKLGDEKLGTFFFFFLLAAPGILIPSTDTRVRANVAVELRDNIEPLCSGANYPIFLAKLWPVFKTILKGDPVFTNLSFEQVFHLTEQAGKQNQTSNGTDSLLL